jgi:hypothetical protein
LSRTAARQRFASDPRVGDSRALTNTASSTVCFVGGPASAIGNRKRPLRSKADVK